MALLDVLGSFVLFFGFFGLFVLFGDLFVLLGDLSGLLGDLSVLWGDLSGLLDFSVLIVEGLSDFTVLSAFCDPFVGLLSSFGVVGWLGDLFVFGFVGFGTVLLVGSFLTGGSAVGSFFTFFATTFFSLPSFCDTSVADLFCPAMLVRGMRSARALRNETQGRIFHLSNKGKYPQKTEIKRIFYPYLYGAE